MYTPVLLYVRQLQDSHHENQPHKGHHLFPAGVMPVGERPTTGRRSGADTVLGIFVGFVYRLPQIPHVSREDLAEEQLRGGISW